MTSRAEMEQRADSGHEEIVGQKSARTRTVGAKRRSCRASRQTYHITTGRKTIQHHHKGPSSSTAAAAAAAAAVRQAEYRRLKAIIPSVADRKSVSKVLPHI